MWTLSTTTKMKKISLKIHVTIINLGHQGCDKIKFTKEIKIELNSTTTGSDVIIFVITCELSERIWRQWRIFFSHLINIFNKRTGVTWQAVKWLHGVRIINFNSLTYVESFLEFFLDVIWIPFLGFYFV